MFETTLKANSMPEHIYMASVRMHRARNILKFCFLCQRSWPGVEEQKVNHNMNERGMCMLIIPSMGRLSVLLKRVKRGSESEIAL